MDKQWFRSVRRRIAQVPVGDGGRRRYSADLREEILTLEVGWRETGRPRAELARELGMLDQTLSNWIRRDAERERAAEEATRQAAEAVRAREAQRTGAFVKEVELDTSAASASAITLALPTGARIEGLTIADVVEIVSGVR